MSNILIIKHGSSFLWGNHLIQANGAIKDEIKKFTTDKSFFINNSSL